MTAPIEVADAAALAELLRADPRRPVRLRGRGSQQELVPPPPTGAVTVSLHRLDRIERLQPGDQTCSVQPAVTLAELEEALRPHGLELGLPGTGSLGGVLALDRHGPLTPGGPSPRTILLGMSAVLAEGLPFQSGARVVKSVAGFDVHKLLLGSRGRLFAATLLHLRLRPRPRAAVWFRRSGLDATAAGAAFAALRQAPTPPARVELWRAPDGGFAISGRMTGRTSAVNAALRRHELPEADGPAPLHVAMTANDEVVGGNVPISALPALVAALPAAAPLLVRGGGRFETALPRAAADALLATLPALGVDAAVLRGTGERLGTGTPVDPGAAHLQAALKRALDPHGVLV